MSTRNESATTRSKFRCLKIASASDTIQLWHERLGHQNKHVEKLFKQQEIDVIVNEEFCEQ